jgi:tetratricopeptide (TPR) repeat protein
MGLHYATRERFWGTQMPQLVKLRQAQASAALNRAVALRPDLPQAHFQLAQLYEKMGYLDLALKHWQTYSRLAREAGLTRGDNREQLEKYVERLTQMVQTRESSVALNAADAQPRDRAFQAFQNNLAGKALDVLLESDRAAFGDEGMELELELLLGVGRAHDVVKWLSPEHERDLGALQFHWLLVRAFAATGDYTRAEEECDEAARALALAPGSTAPLPLRENLAFMVAKHVLDGSISQGASSSTFFARINQEMLHKRIQEMLQKLRNQADLTAVHGLLALEEGEIEEARSAFRAALALRRDQPIGAWDGSWDFNGRILAQECLHWLK